MNIHDFFLGHDAVDWIAAILMFFSIVRLGARKRDGFLWSAGAAIAWVVFNSRLTPVSAPGIAINAIVLVLSLRSWSKWGSEKAEGNRQ